MLTVADAIVVVGLLLFCAFFAFLHYYERQHEYANTDNKQEVTEEKERQAEHARTQLIGGKRFLENYGHLLEQLRRNENFMQFIRSVHSELNGEELTNTRTANRKIANRFYYGKINDEYAEVRQIAIAVRKYGTQASAHISIYYAMFILE